MLRAFQRSQPRQPERTYTPRRSLADRTRISHRTIDRACTGRQKTVSIDSAITIFEELGAYGEAAELKNRVRAWAAAMEDYHSDRLEYLENLARIAQMLLVLPLTPTEWTALDDLPRFLREVHHEASTDDHVLTLRNGSQREKGAFATRTVEIRSRSQPGSSATPKTRSEPKSAPPSAGNAHSTKASHTPSSPSQPSMRERTGYAKPDGCPSTASREPSTARQFQRCSPSTTVKSSSNSGLHLDRRRREA